MSLTPPKRLFHVPTMSTVMYEDVADDVKEKGYAAISHVWGEQKMYSIGELGINGGMDWEIPLSNPNKIHRTVDTYLHYEIYDIFLKTTTTTTTRSHTHSIADLLFPSVLQGTHPTSCPQLACS